MMVVWSGAAGQSRPKQGCAIANGRRPDWECGMSDVRENESNAKRARGVEPWTKTQKPKR